MSIVTIKELQADILNWADSISSSRMPKDAVVKMVSETSELLDAVLNRGDVPQELADCFILLLDLADMYHVDLVEEAVKKMHINRQRRWRNLHGVIRRVPGAVDGVDPL